MSGRTLAAAALVASLMTSCADDDDTDSAPAPSTSTTFSSMLEWQETEDGSSTLDSIARSIETVQGVVGPRTSIECDGMRFLAQILSSEPPPVATVTPGEWSDVAEALDRLSAACTALVLAIRPGRTDEDLAAAQTERDAALALLREALSAADR